MGRRRERLLKEGGEEKGEKIVEKKVLRRREGRLLKRRWGGEGREDC